ncbi:MAG: hypothetical protein HQL90_01640 [Magnetococcales bacterium]|nr:hypothetical protein [Magnetococcales bacterium]
MSIPPVLWSLTLSLWLVACSGPPSTTPLADRWQENRSKAAQLFRECRTDLAMAEYRKVLYLAELRDDQTGIADALLNLGTVHLVRGEPQEAAVQYRHARERFQALGDPTATLQTEIGLASVQVGLGQPRAGVAAYQQLWQQMEQDKRSLPLFRIMVLNGLAAAYRELGAFSQAHASLDQAEQEVKAVDSPRDLASTWMNRARLYLQQGEEQKAAEEVGRALAMDRAMENVLGIGADLMLLGTLAEKQHKIEQAQDYFRQAGSLFEYCGVDRQRIFSPAQRKYLQPDARNGPEK